MNFSPVLTWNGLKNWFLDKTRDICARMEDSREKEELQYY